MTGRVIPLLVDIIEQIPAINEMQPPQSPGATLWKTDPRESDLPAITTGKEQKIKNKIEKKQK